MNKLDELEKLVKLKEQGILTEEEFTKEKKKLFSDDFTNKEELIYEGKPTIFYNINQIFLALLSGGILFIYYWLKSITRKYKMTSQRVIITEGIFSKTTKNVELYRLDDFAVNYPITMRILGFGILIIRSSDRETPNLNIVGIKELDKIAEKLRECSLSERERRGIKVWTKA